MNLCEASDELKQKYLARMPRAEMLDGIILQVGAVTPKSVLAIKDMELGPDDIVIASAQKSGTMWMAEVLSAISHEGDVERVKSLAQTEKVTWLECDHDGLLEEDSFSGQRCSVKSGKKTIWYTHLLPGRLPTSVLEGKCKLLYVARNPKDQAVSQFNFQKLFQDGYAGKDTELTWDEFFALKCSGFLIGGCWFENVLQYWKFCHNNPNAKFLIYEDMKKDLAGEVKRIEEFIGIHLTEEQRSKTVEHCSFSSMKKSIMVNTNGEPIFDSKHGKFMRKGTVGDWKNYFTVAQNEAFDELYKKKMEGYGLQFKYQ